MPHWHCFPDLGNRQKPEEVRLSLEVCHIQQTDLLVTLGFPPLVRPRIRTENRSRSKAVYLLCVVIAPTDRFFPNFRRAAVETGMRRRWLFSLALLTIFEAVQVGGSPFRAQCMFAEQRGVLQGPRGCAM